MGIGILEYTASFKLSSLASELRGTDGANEAYTLLAALYRACDPDMQYGLVRAFPGTFEEMNKRYHASAGLLYPGERIVIGNLLCVMGNDGKITYTEVKSDEECESED